jgi:hypothetical protein
MRLAMAEVLAADHDDCLPVVFDDAFAYSDPDRVQTLQRMLDVAAARGLQVIVLTCTPSDYTALGAQTISLRVSRSPVAHLARPSPEGADETEVEDAPAQPPMAVTDGQRQMLLTALREAGGKAGNIALRETLGWNEETYEAVREVLVAAGEITPGRGRGGSVLIPGLASS